MLELSLSIVTAVFMGAAGLETFLRWKIACDLAKFVVWRSDPRDDTAKSESLHARIQRNRLILDFLQGLQFKRFFPKKPSISFNEILDLASLLWTKRTREQFYVAQSEELKEDFYFAKKRFPRGWKRKWVSFCFAAHFVHLIFSAAKCSMSFRGRRAFEKLIGFVLTYVGRS